jgi:hypothetical protein
MFENTIAMAAQDDAEFATLADTAARITTFQNANMTVEHTSESLVNVTVNTPNVGTFALRFNPEPGTVIQSVDDWYAYHGNQVFLDEDGGTFVVRLGGAADPVTHITALPMRARLISLSGDGTQLSFTLEGEGQVQVALNGDPSTFTITGADSVVLLGGNAVGISLDNFATHTVNITANAVGSVPVEASFASIAAEDGWVRESNENSDVGGSRNTSGTGSQAIRMGDHKGDQQYKAVLSFDTSSIPDGATITAARLELTRGADTGQNPFNTHGICYVDIKTGGFNGNAALENGDFQAPADGVAVATVANQGGSGTVYMVDLNAAGNYVNKAGRTQLRLYFSLDDNDDLGTDIAGFYSADNSNAARHPRLIVTYQE